MEPSFEAVHSDVDSSFRSMRFSCTSFVDDHTWHYHPEYELTWIMQGQGTRFVGDSIESYRSNDMVLIGPNLPHCYHDEPQPNPRHRMTELAVLQFRAEAFGADFFDVPEARQVAALLRASVCGLHIRHETAARLRPMMVDIIGRTGIGRLIGLLEILDVMARGLDDLRPLASPDYHINNDITATNRRRIEMIHAHVRRNLEMEINQAEVAALVGLTPSAFSRFFRKATGQTFVGFVNILRVNEACRRLAETDACITEIAFSCGYWSIANFNRQFLQLKGMNPTQFRERRLRLIEHRSAADPAGAKVA